MREREKERDVREAGLKEDNTTNHIMIHHGGIRNGRYDNSANKHCGSAENGNISRSE